MCPLPGWWAPGFCCPVWCGLTPTSAGTWGMVGLRAVCVWLDWGPPSTCAFPPRMGRWADFPGGECHAQPTRQPEGAVLQMRPRGPTQKAARRKHRGLSSPPVHLHTWATCLKRLSLGDSWRGCWSGWPWCLCPESAPPASGMSPFPVEWPPAAVGEGPRCPCDRCLCWMLRTCV